MSRSDVLPVRAMQVHGGMALQVHSILLFTLASKVWSNSLPGRFTASDNAADMVLDGPQHRSGARVERFDFRTILLTAAEFEAPFLDFQPVACHYTDRAIAASG